MHSERTDSLERILEVDRGFGDRSEIRTDGLGMVPATVPESIGSIRDTYAGRLLPGLMVNTFRNGEHVFPTRVVRRGGIVRALLQSSTPLEDVHIVSNGQDYDLFDYISRNRVAGLLILKNGKIKLEHYEFGLDGATRWMSMSMAKSVSSALIGAAIQDGYLPGVDEFVTRYLPELTGSAYEGVSVRNLLQMSSGVRWDDSHTVPTSQRRQMLELQIQQKPGAIMRFIASQPRLATPGTAWNYSTGETHVIGALLRAVVGRWLADYLSEKIWLKLGMESDATWWLESPQGLEVAGSGISATLRDYARFGMFILNGGIIDGLAVLPQTWVRESTMPRKIGDVRVDYGYMWWPVPNSKDSFTDGAFAARGIFGQFMYINPREQVVIVVLSARSKPKGAEAIVDNDFFNAAVASLQG
jgi:CubicO group peptidase (beta-lactamase class C family)